MAQSEQQQLQQRVHSFPKQHAGAAGGKQPVRSLPYARMVAVQAQYPPAGRQQQHVR